MEGKPFLQMLATAISEMVCARVRFYNRVRGSGVPFRLLFDNDYELLAKFNNIYRNES
ncbi:hypothetical protein MUN46_003355 [Mesosutterella sp. AGMB02718]|uniref:Transposase n=1 Tax=Mesosutterella faecium TaxID=2925194 RepID=A0ABT7IKU3_9BURK|nr:hypothetical protein [Mesosutterella sp. AGMB02718]MDL2058985.1 hypothetical protein [Mesosutterella sp. AGMB02718]